MKIEHVLEFGRLEPAVYKIEMNEHEYNFIMNSLIIAEGSGFWKNVPAKGMKTANNVIQMWTDNLQ